MAIEFLLYVERTLGVSVPDQVAASLQTAGQVLEQARSLSPADEAAPRPIQIRSARPYAKRSATDQFLLRTSFATLKGLYKSYFQLRLHNPEHFPRSQSYIIAANHSSHLDAAAVIASLGVALGPDEATRLHVLGARDYFFDHTFKGWALSALLNLVPVEREEASLASLRLVTAILAEGEPVLIFPEGTRSRTGRIQDFKPGIGLIAAESGAPIVPIYIQGAYRAMPPGATFPRPTPIEVFLGPAIKVEADDGAAQGSQEERYRPGAAQAHQAVVELGKLSRDGK